MNPLEEVERRFGTRYVQCVYASETPDGIEIAHAKRLANAGDRQYVAILAGALPLRAFLHRRYEASKQPSGLFGHEIRADLLELEQRQADALLAGHEPAEATRQAIRAHDPDTDHLVRLWDNGASYPQICALSGQPLGVTRSRVDHLRAMGFELANRRAFSAHSA